ncbi:MAG: sensor domain-containing diguanylate cyclase [Deltaproteobacteria bacterium]|nr:sensor domain-containing diguanylate cyclase [Candidatus Anaeroferrophillus wilburensis]MBN2887758.1 sensor domain-containing diguanylate cyclase [Deltaproteobacteria bacterium]
MTDDILQENRQLRYQLQHLLQNAQQNEIKKLRFDELELELISAGSITELVQLITGWYRTRFKIDFVTLALVDQEYELRRIAEETEPPWDQLAEILFISEPATLQNLYAAPAKPLLQTYDSRCHTFLFPQDPLPPASVALLPLTRQGRLLGSLNLGSRQKERYMTNGSTDFLEHLAAVVAICLENTINIERLQRVALTDSLTGVFNRGFFDRRLGDEVSRAYRYGQPLSCLFLDLDHFKTINDRLGHQSGDQVLRGLTRLINIHLRRSDIIARYGGEEFVILLPHTTGANAFDIAERIRQTIENHHFTLQQHALGTKVTISIGIATLVPSRGTQPPTAKANILVEAADQALLEAKKRGRNLVVCAQGVLPRQGTSEDSCFS